MKIGNPDHRTPLGSAERVDAGKAPKARSNDGIASAAGEPSATVALSVSAAAVAAAGADFDAPKVERIAQAIRDGHYEINAEAIADKLIANAQEVLGRVNR